MFIRAKLLCVSFLAALLSLGAALSPCDDPATASLPFCNHNLDVAARVKDLLPRLSVIEKIAQLGNTAPPIPLLKIPGYQWWSEALHGVASSPGVHFGGAIPAATSFPQVIGLGATFNMTLVHSVAEAISTEGRAMANAQQSGLTYFTPNVNIYRDPRWGRGQETPGEDPYLTAQYAAAFVTGMQQGKDARYLKSAVCCKHFAAYDLENWNGTDRHHFDAKVSEQDLTETYFPAFKACVVEGAVASIMCSYNSVNGIPSCANDHFQNQIVRGEWGFQGFIVSDCGAINDIEKTHHYTQSSSDTVKAALKGGTDLNCGSFYQLHGLEAYSSGPITEADIDLAVGRLFATRMRLGLFEPTAIQPYKNITASNVSTLAHQELALNASRESIVLLKNDGTLPLSKRNGVSLIGPNYDATTTMQGNYHGKAPYLISPLEGIMKMGVSVLSMAVGCDVSCNDNKGFAIATAAAKKANTVILVLGLDQTQESEGHDRNEITLPGMQGQLLTAVKAAMNSSQRLVVVLMSGGPVDITWAKENANAVLWCGYPGQSGGQALAEILFGDVNPSGRLPVTIYPADYVDKISFFDMGMRSPPGRTYKFYTGEPVYSFGQGLSYTTFTYTWSEQSVADMKGLRISRANLKAQGFVDHHVTVTNTGTMAGAVSVLAFMSSDVPGAPLRELFGFQKVFLQPNESVDLSFAVSVDNFSLVTEKGIRELLAGNYTVQIGDLEHCITLV